ncbi:ferritin-like fold-containing protein [Isoptericola cucumis]|uniref:ferritin-like fold-containing protein n=1 Tax=Isoptericola cucumis TaxID=1776856 RepID=UPI003209D1AF
MDEQRSTPGTWSGTGTTGGPQGPCAAAPDALLEELVGLAAYTELATFGLLASRSVDAVDLATRQTLAEAAAGSLERQGRLLGLVAADGRSAATVMTPFAGAFADFDARTSPGSWSEGLLKGVVGHGVAQDLCRELAAGLSGAGPGAFARAYDEPAPGGWATTLLADAAAGDSVLASRLALWGRRVVGEALGLVQTVLGEHPRLARLAARARAAGTGDAAAAPGTTTEPGQDADVLAWLLQRLTAEHTRRMDRLGLAA